MSQAELADRLGHAQSWVSKVEADDLTPSYEVVVRWMRLCGWRVLVVHESDIKAE